MPKKSETIRSERTEGRWAKYGDKAGEALVYSTVYVWPWAGCCSGLALVASGHVIEGLVAVSAGIAPLTGVILYMGQDNKSD